MNPHEAIKAHMARRPELPRPYNPASKAARDHQQALQAWVDELERLECAARVVALPALSQQPVVAPAADYDFRDYDAPVTRRSGPRPAWCGATPEYNAQKARESRARKIERQRVLRAAEKAKALEGAKAALESAKKRKVA